MPRFTTWVRYWAWTFLVVAFGVVSLKYGLDTGRIAVSTPQLLLDVMPQPIGYLDVVTAAALTATLLVWLFRREVKRHVQAAADDGDDSGKMSLRRLVRYTVQTTVVAFLGLAGLKYFDVISGVWPTELVPLSYMAVGAVAAGLGVIAFIVGFWRYR